MRNTVTFRGILMGTAIGIYLAFSLVYLRLPGLQYDETLFAAAVLDPQPSAEWQVQLGGRNIPLMLMPYLGALKAHAFRPLFACFGGGAATVRLPVIVIGLGSLLFTYRLARSMLGEKAAVITFVLFASDPAFVFANKLDWGPVSVMMALKMGALWLFWKWLHGTRSWHLVLCGFLLGLGVYDKVIFAWSVVGLAVAVLVCYRSEVRARLTRRVLSFSLAAFLAGAAPVLAYNLVVPFGTLRRSPHTERPPLARELRYRADLFRSTLDGSAVLGMLNREEPELLRPALARYTGTLLDKTAGLLVRMHPMSGTVSFWMAGLALIVTLVLIRRGAAHRNAARFLVVLLLVTGFLAFITPDARGPHHVVVLLPFTHMLAAYVLSRQGTRARFVPLVPAAAAAVLVFSHVAVGAAYLKSFEMRGGAGNWSDAIYDLDRFLRAQPDRALFLMDWGFKNQLLALSPRKPCGEEVFLRIMDRPAEQRIEAIYPYLLPPSAMMVFHMPRFQTYPTFDVFRQALMRYGLEARAVRVLLQRDGYPVIAACEVVHPEVDAHTRAGRYFRYFEAEDSLERKGGADELKPGASAGRMLGEAWGSNPADFARYAFDLSTAVQDLHLYARYSYYSPGGRRCSVLLDGKQVSAVDMPYRAGAEGRPEQWEWSSAGLGSLGPGEHHFTVSPTGSGPGVNLDCFYFSEGELQLNPILPRAEPDPARPPLDLEVLGYQDRPDVHLQVNTHEILRGQGTLELKLVNLRARTIDLQYTLDGRRMPLIYGWKLDDNYAASVALDLTTRPGLYRYVAVKDSQDPSPASWIRVDVPVLVK